MDRFGLVEEARARGIEPVVLGPDDDPGERAREAVAGGARVLGMAGGDGSLGPVAGVAAEGGLAFVCVPAGTRNHFALDLGLDAADPVRALDGFRGRERRVDLGTVDGRWFVNNVSLGLYAQVVHEPGYREAKAQKALELLPELLTAEAPRYDLRFSGPSGERLDFAQMLLVSNNAYELAPGSGFGRRDRLDTGELGVVAMAIEGAPLIPEAVKRLLADPGGKVDGFHRWRVRRLDVTSDDETVLAGVDGEALRLRSPLRIESRPRALRVRLPRAASRRARLVDRLRRLWRRVAQRETADSGSSA